MSAAYTPELAEAFCAALADGATIRAACKLEGMPSKATVFRWLREKPEFVELYELATDERADTMIDEIVELADNAKGTKVGIAKAKLQIYARIEAAQKMKPKKYGAKIQTEVSGRMTVNSVKDMTDDQLAIIAAGGSARAAGEA